MTIPKIIYYKEVNMIIESSAVAVSSKNSYQKTTTDSIKVVSASGGVRLELEAAEKLEIMKMENVDRFDFYSSGNQADRLGFETGNNKNVNSTGSTDENVIKNPQEMRMEAVRRMLEAFTGKRFAVDERSLLSSALKKANPQNQPVPIQTQNGEMQLVSSPQIQKVSLINGFSFVREFTQTETQSVSYNATGVVKTADGQTISFGMSMNMSQSTETYLQEKMGITFTRAVDPLIINYGGTAASLTDEKFDFDLDADGIKDNISFAGAGSGFLALDKNDDGVINDGSELFGPQSGNGFDELRKYDKDNNGWIDEADEVYDQLKVWCKDKDGNDILYSLKELNVGAIYLNESKTEFTMYDSNGSTQGDMRSTSFFLKEDGSGTGFVSHFDLLA